MKATQHILLLSQTLLRACRTCRALAFALIVLLIATACDRRPLEEEIPSGEYAKILLLTDWRNLDEIPTGMTAMFFPESGGQPTTIMTNNIGRNVVNLKRGKYKVLIFNQSIYEFGSMTFSGMDTYETACANLNKLTGNSTTTAADYSWFRNTVHSTDSLEMAVRTPELFNADRITYEVTPELCKRQHELDNNPSGWDIVEEYVDTIFSIPPPVPPTMHIKVRIKGLNNAYQVKGYITNMAKGNLFGPYRNNEEEAIHVLGNWTLTPDNGDKTRGYATTTFRCFGVPGMQVSTAEILHTSRYWQPYFNQPAAARSTAPASSSCAAGARAARSTAPVSSSYAPGARAARSAAPVSSSYTAGARATRASNGITSIDYGDNTLFLEFLLKDGKTHRTFAFDVTNDIVYTEDQLRLDVVIEIAPNSGGDTPPVILPDVDDVIGSGGAGFDATVEDWKHEDHNISF